MAGQGRAIQSMKASKNVFAGLLVKPIMCAACQWVPAGAASLIPLTRCHPSGEV